jgi:hypothetical protein
MPKTCPQCQSEAADTATFCPNCGASLAPAATAGEPSPPPPPSGAPAAPAGSGASTGADLPPYRFDAARWTMADRIAGIATVVLFISLFLDWFTASYAGFSGGSESGVSAHGWLYVVMILCILIFAYLGLRAGWDELPGGMNIPHVTSMMAVTIVNFVLVLIAFLDKPSVPISGISVGWSFGAVLALIAAAVAAAPYAIPQLRAKTM